MEIITRVDLENFAENTAKNSKAEFLSELAKGQLWAEVDRQEQFIKGLTNELENMEDKDSFKGQYLETWIESLKLDLKEDKKWL